MCCLLDAGMEEQSILLGGKGKELKEYALVFKD